MTAFQIFIRKTMRYSLNQWKLGFASSPSYIALGLLKTGVSLYKLQSNFYYQGNCLKELKWFVVFGLACVTPALILKPLKIKWKNKFQAEFGTKTM